MANHDQVMSVDTQTTATTIRETMTVPSLSCEVRVLLSQSLFAALLEQTYEDTSLSATGYLGGYTQRTTIVVDDQKRECLLCFICDLVASERVVGSLLDAVPQEGAGALERAMLLFRDRELEFIGWYRSIPAHQPFAPTEDDLQRQCFLQHQFPWSVSVLMTSTTPYTHHAMMDHTVADVPPELMISRVASGVDGVPYWYAVPFAFVPRPFHDPILFRRQQHVLVNTLAESKKAHGLHLADNEGRQATCTMANIDYDGFLTRFWRNGVLELSRSIEHDFRTLAVHKLYLKRRISERIQALAQMRAECRMQTEEVNESGAMESDLVSGISIPENIKAFEKLLTMLAQMDTENKGHQFFTPTSLEMLPQRWFTRIGAPSMDWNASQREAEPLMHSGKVPTASTVPTIGHQRSKSGASNGRAATTTKKAKAPAVAARDANETMHKTSRTTNLVDGGSKYKRTRAPATTGSMTGLTSPQAGVVDVPDANVYQGTAPMQAPSFSASMSTSSSYTVSSLLNEPITDARPMAILAHVSSSSMAQLYDTPPPPPPLPPPPPSTEYFTSTTHDGKDRTTTVTVLSSSHDDDYTTATTPASMSTGNATYPIDTRSGQPVLMHPTAAPPSSYTANTVYYPTMMTNEEAPAYNMQPTNMTYDTANMQTRPDTDTSMPRSPNR